MRAGRGGTIRVRVGRAGRDDESAGGMEWKGTMGVRVRAGRDDQSPGGQGGKGR